MYQLKIKRVYEPSEEADGYRILADRLWPRGLSKEKARLDEWAKTIAPSSEDRKAFHAGTEDWATFSARYRRQLDESEEAKAFKAEVQKRMESGNVTLLYGSKDTVRNNAVLLRDWLES